MSDNNVKQSENKPIYKKWWFWVIIVLFLVGFMNAFTNTDNKTNTDTNSDTVTVDKNEEDSNPVKDYSGQDAMLAYTELIANKYTVKFVFDRANNGGFTDEAFQDFVINDGFNSPNYSEMPFVVKRQEKSDKTVTLYIDYGDIVEGENAQAKREQELEKKLSIVSAMSACEIYGKSHYKNFKLHGITGKIAEYASDDNTWFLKYYVDADGYSNKNMECYVSGTTNNPSVTKFLIY